MLIYLFLVVFDADSSVWNEATGAEASQSGTGGLLHFTDDGATTYGDLSHAPLSESVGRRYYKVREVRH